MERSGPTSRGGEGGPVLLLCRATDGRVLLRLSPAASSSSSQVHPCGLPSADTIKTAADAAAAVLEASRPLGTFEHPLFFVPPDATAGYRPHTMTRHHDGILHSRVGVLVLSFQGVCGCRQESVRLRLWSGCRSPAGRNGHRWPARY